MVIGIKGVQMTLICVTIMRPLSKRVRKIENSCDPKICQMQWSILYVNVKEHNISNSFSLACLYAHILAVCDLDCHIIKHKCLKSFRWT